LEFDHIFRAYDIRGVFGEDLTEEIATKIGAAFATFIDGKAVIVGRDVRLSGEKLRNALISGLVTRCNVTDVGVVPTPLLYFALNYLQKDAGIMVTASHNPPQWNGFKAFREKKGSIYGKDMETIKQLTKDVDLERCGEKKGKSVKYETRTDVCEECNIDWATEALVSFWIMHARRCASALLGVPPWFGRTPLSRHSFYITKWQAVSIEKW